MKPDRMIRPSALCGLVVATACAAGMLSTAGAAILYWDGSDTTVNSASDNATTTGQNWLSGGNWDDGATSAPVAAWAAGDAAVFGGSAASQTVTAGTLTVGNLTFGSGGDGSGTSGTAYTVTGGTITFSTSTVTTNTNATIGSTIAGTTALTKAGDGVLVLSGTNSHTGNKAVTAGTLTLGTGAANGSFGTGTYTISNGATLRMNNTTTAVKPTWANISGAGTFSLKTVNLGTTNGDWGQANLPATFTGLLRIESGRVYTSGTAGTNNYGIGAPSAIEVQTGGHLGLWNTGTTLPMPVSIIGTGYGEAGYEAAIRMANSAGTTTLNGVVTMTGNATIGAVGIGVISQGIAETVTSNLTLGTGSMGGTMELRGANTYSGTTTVNNGTLVIGSTAGTSTAAIYGGSIVNQLTVAAGKKVRFASTGVAHTISGTVGGTGNVEVSGTSAAAATLNVATGAVINPGQLVIGDNGVGTYNQTGGTVIASNTGNVWVANNPGGSGSTLTVSGGTLDGGTGTSVLGVRGSYSFNVAGTGQVTMGILQLGHTGGTTNDPTGRITNLNGTAGSSSLRVGAINLVSGNATMNFDGGKLVATAAFNPTATIVTRVKAGGAYIDTNTFNMTVGSPLIHDSGLGATPDGGLTKLGAGTLALTATPTYTGPTTVAAGTLSMPEFSNTSAIAVDNGAALAISGVTGTTIGGITPLTSLTLGSTPDSGGATLSFGNFVSDPAAPLIYATDVTTKAADEGVVVNLTGGTFTGTGTFPLVWYDNASIGGDGFAAFKLGTLPRSVDADLADNAQSLDLVVNTFNPLVWNGTVAGGVWDVNNTANWQGIDTKYLEGDIVWFDATATGTTSVALNSAVAPAGVRVANADYSIAGTGSITGATGLTKSGTGTLTLGTSNTYTGLTSIEGGTIKVGHPNALGSTAAGTEIISGATLDLNGTAIAAEPLAISGTGVGAGGALVNNSVTAAATASPIVLGGATSLGGVGTMTLSGDITGTDPLTKVGAGTTTFSTRKSYTGGTVVDGGILDLTGGGGAAGTIRGTVTVNAGGTLRISTGDATGYDLNNPRLTTINLAGGTMNINTTSNQTLGAAAINMTGATLTGLPGSNLDFFTSDNNQPGRSSLTTLASAAPSVVTGVRLKMRQNDGVIFTIADGAAPIDFDVQSNIASDAFTNNQLVKEGPGVMRISGLSTYTAPTVINAGALIVPAAQSSPSFTVADGTTLEIAGLSGTSFSTGTLTLGTTGSTTLNVGNFGGQTLPANAPVKISSALNLDSAATLNIGGFFPSAGVFPVISYPTTGITGAGSFTLGPLPRNVVASLQDNPTDKTIELNISAFNPLFWDGDVNGNWDVNTTANWTFGGNPDEYLQSDIVIFDDSATGSPAVVLNTAVAPGAMSVNNTTKNYSITGSGGIVGGTSLIKTGTGTLTLATVNGYTGGTLVSAGTLQLGDGTNNGSVTGDIVNNSSLVLNNGSTVTMTGTISGTGSLGKLGPGTIVLTTAPTCTGATTIGGGTLQVPTLTATSSITTNATLAFNQTAASVVNPANVITGTGSVAYTGPPAAVANLGQYLVDDSNTYLGGTTISTSRVNLTTATGLGSGPITVTDGGQLYATGTAIVLSQPVAISGLGWPEAAGILGAVRLNNGATIAGPVTLGSNSRVGTYSSHGIISGPISGAYNLEIFSQAGQQQTLSFAGSAPNTYGGATGTTTVTSGILALVKTGGVTAVPGNLVIGNPGSGAVWATTNTQIGGSGPLVFTGTSGNGRFHLLGMSHSFAGLANEASANNTAVVQNSEPQWSPADYGTGTMVLNVATGQDYTFSNGYFRNATGVLALTKNGGGRQTLGGTLIDHTGATTVNAGDLRLLDLDDCHTTALTIAPGATVTVENAVRAFTGFRSAVVFSGSGTLIKKGLSNMTWSWSNGSTMNFGSGALIDVQEGEIRLEYGGSGNWMNNRADLALGTTGTFNTWDAGQVRFDSLTGTGLVTRGYDSTGSAGTGTLVLGVDNGSAAFNGVIADRRNNVASILNLVKRGTGSQTLNGVNTYAGTTTIEGGTLALGATGSIDNSPAVTIASGAVFDVSAGSGFTQGAGRTITGGRTSGTGNDLVGSLFTTGTVNVAGAGVPATFTVSGDLGLDGGGAVVLDLSSSPASGNDKVVVGGELQLNATTTVNPVFSGTPDTVNPYTIMSYGTISGDASTALVSGLTNSRYALAFDSTTSPGNVLMNVTGTGKSLVWSGPAGGVWVADLITLNWNAGADYFQNLDSVTFDDTSVNGTVTVSTTVSPSSIKVGTQDAGVTAYTISGTGSIAGGGMLTKTGTNTLTLASANSYSGGTLLSQGTLTLTNVAGAGTGPITLGDANTGANNLTLNANVGSGTFANPITVTTNGSGTVTLNQANALSALSGTLTLNRPTTIVGGPDRTGVAGKITGNVGTLTFSGNRTTLDNSVPNDFTGDVVIATAATLQTNSAACLPATASVTVEGTGKLQLNNGYPQTIDALSGGTNGTTGLQIIAGAATTLTIGSDGGSGAFNGNITNNVAALAITKVGAGTQTFGGTNSNYGPTRILGGTLALTNLSALGGSTLVLDNEGGTLDLSALTTGTLNLGGLRGAENLTLNGMSLSVGHASNGDTNVYTGTLTLTGAGLGFTKSGIGNLTLGGSVSNSYSGATTVNTLGANGTSQGSLYLAKTGGAIAIPGNSTVTFGTGTTGQANIRTLYDNQFGPGVVMNFGNATNNWTRFDLLGTSQTLAGIGSGTVAAAASGIVQNVGLNTVSGINPGHATLTLNGNSTDAFYPLGGYVFNGYIRDTDAGPNGSRQVRIVKDGTGTQTIVGANILYTGATTVNAGALVFSKTNALNTSITNNATVEINSVSGDDWILGNGNRLQGTGTWLKTGAGRASLNSTIVTASGPFLIQGGTLRNNNNAGDWTGSTVDMAIAAGAILDLYADAVYVDELTGEGIVQNGYGNTTGFTGSAANIEKFVVGTAGGSSTFTGVIRNNATSTAPAATTAGGGVDLEKRGAGILTLSGPLVSGVPTSNSSFSGNITIDGGKLIGAAVRTGNNTVFGLASNSRTITVNSGTTLEFQAPNTFGGHSTTNVPTIVVNNATVTNADPALSNVINNGLRNVTLNNGTLASTVGNGVSEIDSINRPGEGYGAWGINGTVTSTGTSFISTTATGMASRVLLGSGVDTTLAVTSGVLTVSAPLQAGDAGYLGGLVKTGAGKLVLSAVNIHSTPTTVSAGTLELTGSLVAASGSTTPSNITVAPGATLMGTGTATGTLAANGIVAPGTSIGTLATGAATFGSTGSLVAEINSTTLTADRLAVTGALNIDPASTLTIIDLGTGTPTTAKLVLITYTGAWNNVPFLGKDDDSTVVVNGNSYTINYNDTEGAANAVTLRIGSADPFDAWADSYNLTGADRAKTADPDGDGYNNLLEFATNSDPTKGGSGPRIYPLMHVIGADNALTLTMAVRKSAVFAAATTPDESKQTATKDMVVYTVEASDDLATWNVVEVTEVTGTDADNIEAALGAKLTTPPIGADWEWHTFRTDDGSGLDPEDFIRLKVAVEE